MTTALPAVSMLIRQASAFSRASDVSTSARASHRGPGIDRVAERDVDARERPRDREPVPRAAQDDPARTTPAIGTSTAPAARAATTAPPFTTPRGPRGPSTANAASAPSRRIARTSAASPRAPPRELDPRTTRKPCSASARACIAPSRERLTSTTVRPPPLPGEQRPLRPVQEGEHPGRSRDPLERRVRHDRDPQRRQPEAGDDPEEPPERRDTNADTREDSNDAPRAVSPSAPTASCARARAPARSRSPARTSAPPWPCRPASR